MTSAERESAESWLPVLLALGGEVRQRIIAGREAGLDMAAAVSQQGGDTIFAVDREVEPLVVSRLESALPPGDSLTLVMEGLGESGVLRIGSAATPPRYRLIIDPIDGTRNIMYDKRAAWFLAALAADSGETTSLADSLVSVMVELPPGKQTLADQFAATRWCTTRHQRVNLASGEVRELSTTPSRAGSLRQGFGQVSNFFPGTKVLAADLMERIVSRTLGAVEPGSAAVFDDQYITTGGQFVELMVGHDRFCCDLRPLFYQVLERRSGQVVRGLECHPYDVGGLLAARQSGVIITDGFGGPLGPRMDVHSPVHWCGYANAGLRQSIEPVIQEWLEENGVPVRGAP